MKFNFPIELGEVFRRYTIENFRELKYYFDEAKQKLIDHQKTDKHAHNANQIDYVTDYSNTIDEAIKKLKAEHDNMVIGANGDGIAEVKNSRVTTDGVAKDLLSQRLDADFSKLSNKIEENYNLLNTKIERIVNVNDFGGDPTGQTDSTQAFVKAFGKGNVHVHMTAGTYVIKGLKLPNNTILSGEGKGITFLRIADDAPAETIGITNLYMDGTAENIGVEDFTIDGNKFRQNKSLQPAGGSRSSNIRFAGVKGGFMRRIKSYDSLLHSFDVTYASDDYYYAGDGVRVKEALESKYIHIDNCEATGFGDDGITTHHSRYLLLTNNYSHDPTPDSGNHNGMEIDDGSQHVFGANNKTENCFGGLEIKAHEPTSAASDVVFNNHLDIRSIRSYNIRHIGHHKATDAKSKTAYNVTLNNCVALYPQYNGAYEGATPRALVVCAYRNVNINNFTAIGDGNFMAGMPVIVVQYRAENVNLNNINIRGFSNAMADIKIFGGANRPKKVTISNVNIVESSKNIGIAGGGGVYDTKIIGGNLQGTGTGNAIEMYNNTAEIIGVNAENYNRAAVISGKEYFYVPSVHKGGFTGGATGSAAIAQRSAVMATTGNSFATSNRSWLLGVGANSTASGSRSGIMNSLESMTNPSNYVQTIVNSRGVKSLGNYHFQMGYNADGTPKESATTIDMVSTSGNIRTKGTVQSGQNFGDYAEYFESQSGQPIPTGTIVTLDGRYVRKAQINDIPLGVVSGTAGVVLGDQMFHHKDKYLKDEFGVTLTQSEEHTWEDDEGNVYSEEVERPIPNPDFNENYDEEEYLSRSERPEWNIIGLIGQVFIRVDETVSANDYIKPNNGVGTKDNVNGFYRVMQVTTPYSQEKGYGVAVCYVHPISLFNKGSVG